jgi:hypothetical protein
MTTPDRQLASWLIDYLSTAESITAGVPALAGFPRVLGLAEDHDATAFQLVATHESTGDHGGISDVVVTLTVHGILTPDRSFQDVTATQRAVLGRVANVSALDTWLRALSTEAKTQGFSILKMGTPTLGTAGQVAEGSTHCIAEVKVAFRVLLGGI